MKRKKKRRALAYPFSNFRRIAQKIIQAALEANIRGANRIGATRRIDIQRARAICIKQQWLLRKHFIHSIPRQRNSPCLFLCRCVIWNIYCDERIEGPYFYWLGEGVVLLRAEDKSSWPLRDYLWRQVVMFEEEVPIKRGCREWFSTI